MSKEIIEGEFVLHLIADNATRHAVRAYITLIIVSSINATIAVSLFSLLVLDEVGGRRSAVKTRTIDEHLKLILGEEKRTLPFLRSEPIVGPDSSEGRSPGL